MTDDERHPWLGWRLVALGLDAMAWSNKLLLLVALAHQIFWPPTGSAVLLFSYLASWPPYLVGIWHLVHAPVDWIRAWAVVLAYTFIPLWCCCPASFPVTPSAEAEQAILYLGWMSAISLHLVPLSMLLWSVPWHLRERVLARQIQHGVLLHVGTTVVTLVVACGLLAVPTMLAAEQQQPPDEDSAGLVLLARVLLLPLAGFVVWQIVMIRRVRAAVMEHVNGLEAGPR